MRIAVCFLFFSEKPHQIYETSECPWGRYLGHKKRKESYCELKDRIHNSTVFVTPTPATDTVSLFLSVYGVFHKII